MFEISWVVFNLIFFFFIDTATTEIYTLSLHDALPISLTPSPAARPPRRPAGLAITLSTRSEEHTSELQSRENIVCRILLEKKKNNGMHDQQQEKKLAPMARQHSNVVR